MDNSGQKELIEELDTFLSVLQGKFQLRLDEDRATLHERNESAQTHEEQEAQILKDDFLARNR